MTTDCPDCGRPLDMTTRHGDVGVCYNCSERHEIGQCEHCGDRYAEGDMTVENAQGATLWFCPDCATTRGVAYE